jgi:2-polyprenyl-6-methoxyphenol hydroxylase-like FAD-dependent oxidoreductase
MYTALALAEKGNKVSVYERDTPPPQGDAEQAFFAWNRRGAAQFRHPHAFLGLLCNLIQDNYPDLLEAFMAAGARRVNFEDMLPPKLAEAYVPAPGDEKLWILMCRRATLETVLRRYVERVPNIEIVNSARVVGVVAAPAVGGRSSGIEVKGLELNQQGKTTEVLADLVVDASGRSSKFPQWFKALGVDIDQEVDDAEIVYYSKHYKLNPGVEEPPRHGKERAAGDLGYLKYGVFPGDNGHFAVIVCVPNVEPVLRAAVRNNEQFDLLCRNIPGLQPWLNETRIEPTTNSFGVGGIQALWRHYVSADKPLALNFFAVGDAAIRTNPLYGRGCSLAVLHGQLLASVLAQHRDPLQRAVEFDRQTEAQLRPIFKASLNEDKSGIRRAQAMARGEPLERTKGFKAWFGAAFGDALAAALRDHVHVVRGMMRTFNLLEIPGTFLKERRIRLTIFRYMLYGRRRNAAARIVNGPSRDEMLALLETQP